MSALTITQAAERLAPLFEESSQQASLPAERPSKEKKWLSLDDAGALLAERVAGEPVKAKQARPEITVREAAKTIEYPYAAELAVIRQKREAATVTAAQRDAELKDFGERATTHFAGMDGYALQNDPTYHAADSYYQQLRAVFDAALQDARSAWDEQCLAEDAVFELEHPDWSQADRSKALEMFMGLGLSAEEIQQLWFTPQPIDVASPACMVIAQMIAGDVAEPIHAALATVGFDDAEIKAVMAGQTPVIMRDHRIQELMARACDAYTERKNSAAA